MELIGDNSPRNRKDYVLHKHASSQRATEVTKNANTKNRECKYWKP